MVTDDQREATNEAADAALAAIAHLRSVGWHVRSVLWDGPEPGVSEWTITIEASDVRAKRDEAYMKSQDVRAKATPMGYGRIVSTARAQPIVIEPMFDEADS